MQIAVTSKFIVSHTQEAWVHITDYTYTQTYFSPVKCAFDSLQQKWIAWTAQFPRVKLTALGCRAWYTVSPAHWTLSVTLLTSFWEHKKERGWYGTWNISSMYDPSIHTCLVFIRLDRRGGRHCLAGRLQCYELYQLAAEIIKKHMAGNRGISHCFVLHST